MYTSSQKCIVSSLFAMCIEYYLRPQIIYYIRRIRMYYIISQGKKYHIKDKVFICTKPLRIIPNKVFNHHHQRRCRFEYYTPTLVHTRDDSTYRGVNTGNYEVYYLSPLNNTHKKKSQLIPIYMNVSFWKSQNNKSLYKTDFNKI